MLLAKAADELRKIEGVRLWRTLPSGEVTTPKVSNLIGNRGVYLVGAVSLAVNLADLSALKEFMESIPR